MSFGGPMWLHMVGSGQKKEKRIAGQPNTYEEKMAMYGMRSPTAEVHDIKGLKQDSADGKRVDDGKVADDGEIAGAGKVVSEGKLETRKVTAFETTNDYLNPVKLKYEKKKGGKQE